MQIHYKLSQGVIQRPEKNPIRSLQQARRQDEEQSEFRDFLDEFYTIKSHISDIVKLDQQDAHVNQYTKTPPFPKEPGFFEKLIPGRQKAHEEATEKWDEWEAGGRDLAEEPGVVVTTRDKNRFGADAESHFDPENLYLPPSFSSKGKLESLRGVGGVEAEFALSPYEKKLIEESSFGGLVHTHQVSYNKEGDQESYRRSQHVYRRPESGEGPMELVENRRVSIKADHATGTLTYIVDSAPGA